MQAPLNHNDPTGSPKRMAAALVFLFIFGSTLFYASRLPALTSHPKRIDSTPQVAGAETTTSKASESVAPDDAKKLTTPLADVPSTAYKIVSTVDGDTVKASIGGKTETIRLIGVDTPETKDPRKKVQCFGKQASDFTHAALLDKSVRLAADNSQDNRDKYGRLLRYIFLEDGTNFNESLIVSGYAYEYTYNVPYLYQKQFKADQAAAEAGNKGLWSPESCSGKR